MPLPEPDNKPHQHTVSEPKAFIDPVLYFSVLARSLAHRSKPSPLHLAIQDQGAHHDADRHRHQHSVERMLQVGLAFVPNQICVPFPAHLPAQSSHAVPTLNYYPRLQ